VVLRHWSSLPCPGARLAEPANLPCARSLTDASISPGRSSRDLIESQTLFQAKVAAQQLEGALSRRLRPIKQKLLELIALLEAGIDFAEDDVSVLPAEQVLRHISAVRAPLEGLSCSFATEDWFMRV